MPGRKICVGNWNEELVFEADRAQQLQKAKAEGKLLSQQVKRKAQQHRAVATLAPLQADGAVRFNSNLILQSSETNAFLSIDTDDRVETATGWKTVVTTAPAPSPQCRNTWVIRSVPSDDDKYFEDKGEGDIVHYGQRFVVQTHPDLCDPPLFLASQAKSPTSFSRTTRNQEVYCTAKANQAALWSFAYADFQYRFEMEGQPVKANSLVVMTHLLTNIPLASQKLTSANDFGAEWEVCCNKYLLQRSKHGGGMETPKNFWAVVTAPPEDVPPNETPQPQGDGEEAAPQTEDAEAEAPEQEQ